MKDNETIRITSICDSHDVQNANLDTYLPSRYFENLAIENFTPNPITW